jgi:acyl dehydratase
MHVAKRLFDAKSGHLVALVKSAYLMRGDGGQGGFGVALEPAQPLPDVEPDATIDVCTLPQSALLYRLCGDLNPIHADPTAAAHAGFSKPILHGLCSMGIATRVLIDTLAQGDPDRIRAVSLRFSNPVFPGETLRIEMFRSNSEIRFRARAVERNVLVLDRGSATIVA